MKRLLSKNPYFIQKVSNILKVDHNLIAQNVNCWNRIKIKVNWVETFLNQVEKNCPIL